MLRDVSEMLRVLRGCCGNVEGVERCFGNVEGVVEMLRVLTGVAEMLRVLSGVEGVLKVVTRAEYFEGVERFILLSYTATKLYRHRRLNSSNSNSKPSASICWSK